MFGYNYKNNCYIVKNKVLNRFHCFFVSLINNTILETETNVVEIDEFKKYLRYSNNQIIAITELKMSVLPVNK